jgi:type-F conjugative transfer system pilin assembly protein TrbC
MALVLLGARTGTAAGIEETARDAAAAMERHAAPVAPHSQDQPGRHYLFISSSIPQAGLLELAKDAKAHRIPMVLRGLVGDSLQDTLVRLQPITATGAALEIDPTLFQLYKIEHVPAVVRRCGGPESRHAIVYGVAPSKALPLLETMLPCDS